MVPGSYTDGRVSPTDGPTVEDAGCHLGKVSPGVAANSSGRPISCAIVLKCFGLHFPSKVKKRPGAEENLADYVCLKA